MNTDGEIRAMQFAPPATAAFVGIANHRSAFVIQLNAVFGAKGCADPTGFAPGAVDVDVEFVLRSLFAGGQLAFPRDGLALLARVFRPLVGSLPGKEQDHDPLAG